MECTPPPDVVDYEQGCACQWWSTTDEVDHCATAGEELNDGFERTMAEWFGL